MLTEQEQSEVASIEQNNPALFEEMACSKRFSHTQKNTSKAMANFKMNNNYWSLLNHVPKKQVGNIVTKRVLEMDQRSCEALLLRIIDEQRLEDSRRQIQQAEREAQRHQLKSKHDQRASLAERLGVKHAAESRSRTQAALSHRDYEIGIKQPLDKGGSVLQGTTLSGAVITRETEVQELNTQSKEVMDSSNPFVGFTDRSHFSGGRSDPA